MSLMLLSVLVYKHNVLIADWQIAFLSPLLMFMLTISPMGITAT